MKLKSKALLALICSLSASCVIAGDCVGYSGPGGPCYTGADGGGYSGHGGNNTDKWNRPNPNC